MVLFKQSVGAAVLTHAIPWQIQFGPSSFKQSLQTFNRITRKALPSVLWNLLPKEMQLGAKVLHVGSIGRKSPYQETRGFQLSDRHEI